MLRDRPNPLLGAVLQVLLETRFAIRLSFETIRGADYRLVLFLGSRPGPSLQYFVAEDNADKRQVATQDLYPGDYLRRCHGNVGLKRVCVRQVRKPEKCYEKDHSTRQENLEVQAGGRKIACFAWGFAHTSFPCRSANS
jgi:hypothetical protein